VIQYSSMEKFILKGEFAMKLKKKITAIILFFSMALTFITPAFAAEEQTLKLNISSVSIGLGDGYTLEATGAKSVTYSSSDETIAKVGGKTGKITALKVGTATVTAKSGSQTATVKVTVKKAPEKITAELVVIVSHYYVFVYLPKDYAASVKLASSDEKIAAVNENGEILGEILNKKSASVKITATTHNGKESTVAVEGNPVSYWEKPSFNNYENLGVANGYSYISGKEKTGIYRRRDGSAVCEFVSEDNLYGYYGYNNLQFGGDWVYYKSEKDQLLYRTKQNGNGGKTKITDEKIDTWQLSGSYVYYRKEKDELIYRVKANGSGGKTKVTKSKCSDWQVIGSYVYYTSQKDGFLYRVKTDGSGEAKKIITDSYIDYIISGDRVYYRVLVGKGVVKSEYGYYDAEYYNIKSVKLNGTDKKTAVSEKMDYRWNITGGKIYYRNINGNFCKINTDGSGRTKISEEKWYKEWNS